MLNQRRMTERTPSLKNGPRVSTSAIFRTNHSFKSFPFVPYLQKTPVFADVLGAVTPHHRSHHRSNGDGVPATAVDMSPLPEPRNWRKQRAVLFRPRGLPQANV